VPKILLEGFSGEEEFCDKILPHGPEFRIDATLGWSDRTPRDNFASIQQ
jgi:hypothetical protein